MESITRSAPSSSNVVRLPTAAKRKPNNCRYVAQTYEAWCIRKEQPWPGEYLPPRRREQERKEAEQRDRLRGICRSPELAIMLAMLQTMPGEQVEKIAGILSRKAGQTPDDDDMRAAAALAQEASDMRRAAEKMAALYSAEAQS